MPEFIIQNTKWTFPSMPQAELDFTFYYKEMPCKCVCTPAGISQCLRCSHPGNPVNSHWWNTPKEIDYSKITKEVLGL